MATLVIIFHKLSKGRSSAVPFPEEEEPANPFCSSSLIKSFIESFPCRDAAQLCFEHATLFAESFDINQLLNHEPTDVVHEYLQIKSTKHATSSTLLTGKIKSSKNLRAAFGFTMIATSFVLLQWQDDASAVIEDVRTEFMSVKDPMKLLEQSDVSWLMNTFQFSRKMIRTRKDNADGDWTAFIVEAFEEATGQACVAPCPSPTVAARPQGRLTRSQTVEILKRAHSRDGYLTKADIFPHLVNSQDYVLLSGIFSSVKMTMTQFRIKVTLVNTEDDQAGILAETWSNKYIDYMLPIAKKLSCAFSGQHDPDNKNPMTSEIANLRDQTIRTYKSYFKVWVKLLIHDGEIIINERAEEEETISLIHEAVLSLFTTDTVQGTERLQSLLACCMTKVDGSQLSAKGIPTLSKLLSATLKFVKVAWAAEYYMHERSSEFITDNELKKLAGPRFLFMKRSYCNDFIGAEESYPG